MFVKFNNMLYSSSFVSEVTIMNPNFKLNLLTLSLLAITSIAHAEDEVSTQELDEIQVKGKHIAKEKKVFTEGQAKSSRERVYQSSENIDTIVYWRSISVAIAVWDVSIRWLTA